ncbi:dTMP kinase [Sulfolobus acidocaldarius]|uniref:dTMP kinase n=1 Tax=Sulfolobus acidocaldarius TaxID=2285 RepID=UPI0007862A9D|nr:dTMP kinase [Sulfolobus acidocaldarius]
MYKRQIDGSGKTTISKIIYEKLLIEIGSNKKIILTSEPFSQEIIKLIEEIGWKDPISLALLFTADRAYHLNLLFKQNPEIIIMDRYIDSTIAYQSSLGIDENWIRNLNKYFPEPDLTILLDLKPETAIARIKNKVDKFNFDEKISTLSKVREKYLELAKRNNKIRIVNAEKSIDEIVEETWSIVYSFLNHF